MTYQGEVIDLHRLGVGSHYASVQEQTGIDFSFLLVQLLLTREAGIEGLKVINRLGRVTSKFFEQR